jgi:hypothetical protein
MTRIASVAMCALIACGKASNGPDATGDSMPAEPDADEPLIRVTVYDENEPGHFASNARVSFVSADQPVQTKFTGSDGVAEAVAPAGTIVTVSQKMRDVPNETVFATFIGLNPGDSVVAGPSIVRPQEAGDFVVRLPEVPDGAFYTLESSCPTRRIGSANVITVTLLTPCLALHDADVLGRVQDVANETIGVTRLEHVDLAASVGTELVMPPYALEAQPVTASLTNIPRETIGPLLGVFYYYDTPYLNIVEANFAVSSDTGTVGLATTAYAIGDATRFSLNLTLRDQGSTFSNYRHHQVGTAADFVFDAGNMMRGVVAASSDISSITWTEAATGNQPTLVAAALRWEGTRGVILSPHQGTSISLLDLPSDLRPTQVPTLVELQFMSADGETYNETVARLVQNSDFAHPIITLPSTVGSGYWRSSFPADVL